MREFAEYWRRSSHGWAARAFATMWMAWGLTAFAFAIGVRVGAEYGGLSWVCLVLVVVGALCALRARHHERKAKEIDP